jgi:hypothetical protein
MLFYDKIDRVSGDRSPTRSAGCQRTYHVFDPSPFTVFRMLFEIGWPREEAVWMVGHFIAPVPIIDSREAAKRSDGERSGTWIGPFR